MNLAHRRYCKYYFISLGFSTKAFRVLSMTFNEDYTITLQLVEHQDSIIHLQQRVR